jgi:hypothetical protein
VAKSSKISEGYKMEIKMGLENPACVSNGSLGQQSTTATYMQGSTLEYIEIFMSAS